VKRLVLPWLRRDEGEIARRARGFAIRTETGRALVDSLGRAFLRGYNSMLQRERLADVARDGKTVPPHFRPFFFEGAAMGYLPRSLYDRDRRAERIEGDLLGLDPAFRYLYYVGIGFWHGLRHPRRPEAVLRMAPHLSASYFPLCFDGCGFKLGFFDFPRRSGTPRLLERAPVEHRPFLYQGFGRALFFVTLDDAGALERILSALPARHRADLLFGHALAHGFTGVDRPDDLVHRVARSADPTERAARLTGITWALTARRMNDPDYFHDCMGRVRDGWRGILDPLPDLCLRAFEGADSYAAWQERTRGAVLEHWTARGVAPPEGRA
jgi:hypothetical protein